VDAELLTARNASRLIEASGFIALRTDYFLCFPERVFAIFSAVERMLSKLPLGGQYALLAQAPR
jgi:hypothetical protein